MSKIIAVSSFLPKNKLTNDELELLFPSWKSEKILDKTGIRTRHIANFSQGSEDLALAAAENLFKENQISLKKDDIDSLIVLTQTSSQIIPSSACKIHSKLDLKENCLAFDINQGCAGYIYGLQVANSMIESKASKYILLLTSDVYSKIINKKEANLSTLFGDGATATLIGAEEKNIKNSSIGPFQFGTDGSKFEKLICKNNFANSLKNNFLYMDGPSILEFTLKKVPEAIHKYLKNNFFSMDDFDYVIFHQANKFILEKLYKKIGIIDKGIIDMIDSGNTASGSIPLAIENLIKRNSYKKSNILLVGFGSGLSWGITSIRI
tara:strand:+ start:75 stop:1040 length:966 start_codon:yes stop_codon:yes gene_type:complete